MTQFQRIISLRHGNNVQVIHTCPPTPMTISRKKTLTLKTEENKISLKYFAEVSMIRMIYFGAKFPIH